MNQLKRVEIAGFKSLRDVAIDFGHLNVLIGANGSGKSNLVSFFKFFNVMMTRNVQVFVALSGGADSLLYYGAKRTPQIRTRVVLETEEGSLNAYSARMVHSARDTLVFVEEEFALGGGSLSGADLTESGVLAGDPDNPTDSLTRSIFQRSRCYQFHDTTAEARIRQSGYIEDCNHLRGDAGNLAAFLHMLREKELHSYQKILGTVRQVAPFFGDFALTPSPLNEKQILLNWRERTSDLLFGPHQLSDGTLRFMALATLLLQPENRLPSVMVIDEPELGLHPFAIEVLASLVREVSAKCQVILATQSVELVNCFEPDEIIVAEREGEESVFKRLDTDKLSEWLEEYSVGELWKKNVIGGRPV